MGCTSAACRSLTCSLLAVLALNGFLPRATLKSRWVFWKLRWCLYANAKHPEERSLWRMVPQFSSSQKSQHFVPVPLILIVSFTPFIMPERKRRSESTIRGKLENMFRGCRPINKDWFLNGSQRKQLRKKKYYLNKRTLLGQDYFYNEKRQQIYYVLLDEKKGKLTAEKPHKRATA